MYKKVVIEQAMNLYVIHRKTLAEIAEIMGKGGPSIETLNRWRERYEWGKKVKGASPVQLSVAVHETILNELKAANENDKLSDPGVIDKISKLFSMLDRIDKDMITRANMMQLLEDLSEYISAHVDDDAFLDKWRALLPELGDYLRKKYGA